MKRLTAIVLGLLALLLGASAALGVPLGRVQGGYDEATGQLEAGFKLLLRERVFSEDECYPPPEESAAALRREMGIEVVIAPDLDSVQSSDLVNVIADQTNCDRLVLAMRAGAKARIFVLDSEYGPVYLAGGKKPDEESQAAGGGPLRDLTAATEEFRMSEAHGTARFDVLCPGDAHPLGGGMVNVTPVAADGEGAYPHSYERLGAQGGFHVTPTLVDRSPDSTATRRVELQIVCATGLVPAASPHETTYVHRHETASATAHCPEGTKIFAGGFQRTNFTTPEVEHGGIEYGGNYITESRAVDDDAWRVSGGATGINGGELTALAYCAEDPSLPVEEVSSTVSVEEGEAVAAVTPRCPQGRALIAGGFSFGGSHDALFADGYFTRAGTWAATGYGWFGSAELTAYGYCAEVRDTVDRSDFPSEPPQGPPPAEDEQSNAFVYAGLGALTIALLLFLRRRQVVRRRRRARGQRATRRASRG
jgi:LPXTG-motif cell wall-anchored protein